MRIGLKNNQFLTYAQIDIYYYLLCIYNILQGVCCYELSEKLIVMVS